MRVAFTRLLILSFIATIFSCYAEAQSSKPQPRYLHHVTYDEQNKQVLILGGNGGPLLNDLWALDQSGWKKLTDEGPPPRIKGAFAYDPTRKKSVLFGGSGSSNQLLNDTWEWDGKSWSKKEIDGPPIRNHSIAVFDRKHQVILMFGGVGPAGLLNDTWAFDGTSWKQLNNDGPKDCLPHGIFYNEVSEKVILITLSVIRDPKDDAHARNDMWEWTDNTWKKYDESASIVSSSNLQTLSSFGKSEIILFDAGDGSGSTAQTLKFSDGHWSNTMLNGPPPRIGASMIFDNSRNKTILFGGGNRSGFFNDLWEWDGKEWKEIK